MNLTTNYPSIREERRTSTSKYFHTRLRSASIRAFSRYRSLSQKALLHPSKPDMFSEKGKWRPPELTSKKFPNFPAVWFYNSRISGRRGVILLPILTTEPSLPTAFFPLFPSSQSHREGGTQPPPNLLTFRPIQSPISRAWTSTYFQSRPSVLSFSDSTICPTFENKLTSSSEHLRRIYVYDSSRNIASLKWAQTEPPFFHRTYSSAWKASNTFTLYLMRTVPSSLENNWMKKVLICMPRFLLNYSPFQSVVQSSHALRKEMDKMKLLFSLDVN